ncbi:hypothetical protein FDI95_gp061 [Citrobacter phage CF1 ERZ-2017]|uniref:Uncharacterized protein n=1 Tax=Citrobacter phage CF1 ERZ-2017 TaxID=2267236 RepID=A0A2H4YG04_9CAUD|nr:hypothetical protein FDI95_gp061 [Citrobacter phage CF1 ERZ-2017]AUE22934.1 hypothetical protein Cf1_00061 [Citrobacter phage CF1 ERZ-2017]
MENIKISGNNWLVIARIHPTANNDFSWTCYVKGSHMLDRFSHIDMPKLRRYADSCGIYETITLVTAGPGTPGSIEFPTRIFMKGLFDTKEEMEQMAELFNTLKLEDILRKP